MKFSLNQKGYTHLLLGQKKTKKVYPIHKIEDDTYDVVKVFVGHLKIYLNSLT